MADLTRISGTVDFDEIAAFQRRAFGDEWLKSERRRLQRAEYYRWKYFPPAGPAWLASIRSGHDMAAMAAAVPFHAAGADGASTAWQICDIAVDPGFRRRGLFARCLAALATAVAGDTTFCFPNRRSRAGLIKAGYAASTLLRVRGRPLIGLAGGKSAAAVADPVSLAGRAAASEANLGRHRHIRRSPEFLRWRYAAHPLNRYVGLSLQDGAGAIVRHLFGGRVGVVVESWPDWEEGMQAGYEAACRWARDSGCWALVEARNAPASAGGIRPWDVVCLARENREPSSQARAEPLRLRLGDWDAV